MTDPASDAADSEESASNLAVRCIRALMERHGLPKHRHSSWLADALGLSNSQAHRRMTGAATWSLEDLERVAMLFGETLIQLVALERTEARASATARKVIAVLDDDKRLADSICAHFESSGYDARSFCKSADLTASAKLQRYDAYVIDWIVGGRSTLKLVASLREADATAPIFVQTAQLLMGTVDERDIAEAVKAFSLVFSEKPVRMSILSASLALAFAATRQES